MTLKEFEKIHIDYYLLLEEDFKETFKYVSLSEDNFNTYSSAYLKLLLTIGSEVDVLLPLIAKIYDSNCKENGYGCSKTILKNEPEFKEIEFSLHNCDIVLNPWKCDVYPEWWTVYNELKHNRSSFSKELDPNKKNYQLANLKNVIKALSGLYSLEILAYRKLAINENNKLIVPKIKTIFTTKSMYWKDISFGSGGSIMIEESLYLN